MTEDLTASDDPGFMRAMLNLVIPPSDRMPGAGDLDLWPAIVAQLRQNPAALSTLMAGLEAMRSDARSHHPQGLTPAAAIELVRHVNADHPALMPTLARMTMFAYYQHPAVLVALGEPARAPFPGGFDLEPISQERLARLKSRAQPGPLV